MPRHPLTLAADLVLRWRPWLMALAVLGCSACSHSPFIAYRQPPAMSQDERVAARPGFDADCRPISDDTTGIGLHSIGTASTGDPNKQAANLMSPAVNAPGVRSQQEASTMQLACLDALLSRDKLDADRRRTALRDYNATLSTLLPAALAGIDENDKDKSGSRLDIMFNGLDTAVERLYLSDFIDSLDPRLPLKVYGELGVGGVTVRRNRQTGLDLFYPLEGIFRSVNLLFDDLQWQQGRWHLTIRVSRVDTQTPYRLGEQSYRLRYTPASAYLMLLDAANIDQLSWTGMISPAKADARLGIFAIEPIAADKIPVFMLHGLNSDPLIWRYLSLAILNTPALHDRFQIWHAYYPSGSPPFYDAMRLRQKLDELLALVPALKRQDRLVVIGHSMGGVIARTLVSRTGYALWDATFTTRPEALPTDGAQQVKDILIFEPRFGHNWAFFLDTPHQGSDTARSFIGRLGSALVTLPSKFINLMKRYIDRIGKDKITPQMLPFIGNYGPNSLEVLGPGHPLMQSLSRLPIEGKAYSVVGSNGPTRCDSAAQCAGITDGVVPFTSAHLAQAETEIIVPSEHNAYQSQAAIDFILKQLSALEPDAASDSEPGTE